MKPRVAHRWPSRSGKSASEAGIGAKPMHGNSWGRRWIQALELALGDDAIRLASGQIYVRSGRTHDLAMRDGVVKARVIGSRPQPYRVQIQLTRHSDSIWNRAIRCMAERAELTAILLSGQMPREIDEVFAEAKTSLFPKSRDEIASACNCPDWAEPCRHIAASHFALGEALDRDPFLLFELRGRTQEQVLAELSEVRRRKSSPSGQASVDDQSSLESMISTVTAGTVKSVDYDRPRADLPAIHLSFNAPVTHGAVLRQLGLPPAWRAPTSPAEMLGPRIRAAGDLARRLALAEPEVQPECAADVAQNDPASESSDGKRRGRSQNAPSQHQAEPRTSRTSTRR